MAKRILLLFVLIVSVAQSGMAVLKEDSLANTLRILRQELVRYHDDYNQRQGMMLKSSEHVFTTMMEAMQRSNQNALMLYSQKDGHVFDLTYACHEAIQQYKDFQRAILPFKTFVEKSDEEIHRMDSLVNCLKAMPVAMLDEKANTDRRVCLVLAVNTRRMVVESRAQLAEYIYYYEMTEKRLKSLSDYAQKRYVSIQNNIFKNGDDTYFSILKNFGNYLTQTSESLNDKYNLNRKVKSQWDARLMLGLFFVILVYGIVAILLNQLIVRWLVTRLINKGKLAAISDWFLSKRKCIIMASTVVTFAIILGIVSVLSTQNFIIMASNLLVGYAWLLSVILISLLIRVKADQVMHTFRIYSPLIVNGFLIFTFRIVLIPNVLVNLIFPPLLLACCIWQWIELHKMKSVVDKSDMFYAYCSQLVFIVSLVSSFMGYALLAVQILIWWIMQLTCILTITCIRDWFREYSKMVHLYARPVTKIWMHTFFYWVVLPVMGVASVMISLYWAADVFNLSDLTYKLFTTKFVNTENFQASIFTLSEVIVLWIIFNYVNHTAKEFTLYYFQKQDPTTAESRSMLFKNVIQVVVWGAWFLITLSIFHVSNEWLVAISAGLSTGIGFASKDILENIYYGISLMTGRIKLGDLIVCDGIRGTVTSISYTSTMITATDGSVIAFQNSQLFTKNYKNMTHNHGYECHILDVGVAYGTDVARTRKLIIDAVSKLDCVYKEKPVAVVLKELADSALVLKVIVWVNVMTQYTDDGIILECIYNTLNENNIEIPFPQRDVHLIHNQ